MVNLGTPMGEKTMTGKNSTARCALRHVCHATFDELSEAGYTVQTVDDGAIPLQMNESMLLGMPDNWMQAEPVIVPKVAILKNATLFHDGSALLPDGLYCNYDPGFRIASRVNYRRHNLSVMHYIDPKHNDALIKPHPKSIAIEGRCFAALHNCSNNYGHFIHDVLTRIYYEDLGVISPGREKVIAPRSPFPMANILFEKVFADYDIVRLPSATAFEVEELVLPANFCSSTRFNPASMAALANRMRKIMEPFVESRGRKICVSRRDGTNTVMRRDFMNVDEFETRMENLGYHIIEASKINSGTQLPLWANATDILGVHGAGMMNFIMMLPGQRFTEIAGAPHPVGNRVLTTKYIARGAVAFGHQVNVVASKLDPKGRSAINIERLEGVLNDT